MEDADIEGWDPSQIQAGNIQRLDDAGSPPQGVEMVFPQDTLIVDGVTKKAQKGTPTKLSTKKCNHKTFLFQDDNRSQLDQARSKLRRPQYCPEGHFGPEELDPAPASAAAAGSPKR